MNVRASLPPGSAIAVAALRDPVEGCVAYVVTERASREALVVDPRLDQVDAILAALRAAGASLRWVIDTHTHADHLSGARQLAAGAGAEHVVHAGSPVVGPVRRVRPGDHLPLGLSEVQLLDAPGHAPDSLALHLEGHLFTGDALHAGGAGRTDLPGGCAGDLFRTLRTLDRLPAGTTVHPGHDFARRGDTTLREERRTNPLLAERDPERFRALTDVPAASPPPGMAELLRWNLGEPPPPTILPHELDALRRAGLPLGVVDVRPPAEFAREGLPGARSVPLERLEAELDAVPERDLVVVCRTGVRAAVAARTLRRLGRRARLLEGGLVGWRAAGLPLAPGPGLGAARRLRRAMGLGLLASLALGLLVSPWLLLVAALLAAGLARAGADGGCAPEVTPPRRAGSEPAPAARGA